MSSNEVEKQEPVEHSENRDASTAVNVADMDVPKGYWTSFRFLGSSLAIVLLANNLFIGYSMPVRKVRPLNLGLTH